jgi:dihydrofolate synthase/folylpolyglutamate synthase
MMHDRTLAAWLTLLETRHPRAIDLGLDRVAAVWQRMGRPQPAARLFTVGGTNGKGSTTAYIAALVAALGYRCGSYTSPHLFRYNERVQIQNKAVSDQELIDAFERVEAARGEISLTYFEFGTLAAFSLMSRAALDFAVLEVGLGGRLDAVNILDADCAVITPVGLDHQEYLGDSLESIGYEKAGIIRAGRPVICGEAEPPQSLLRFASDCGAVLQRLGREFCLSPEASGYRWRKGSRSFQLPPPPMAGRHQVDNMATALAAVSTLIPDALEEPAALVRGLESARLAGRLQASADCSRVWLDVGHNPHAATAVAAALQDLQLRPVDCVLGMLRDKDAHAVAAVLDESVRNWYCAGIGGDRGRSGADLAREVGKVGGADRIREFTDVATALRSALENSTAGANILVFGSFITVAQAAAFLAGRRC